MRRSACFMFLLAAPSAWCAGAIDSPACRGALAQLQAREDRLLAASAPARGMPPAALQALRRQAAVACLGSLEGEPPAGGRLAQPPVAMPPVGFQRQAVPPATAVPLPSQRVPGPSVITSCDLTGCWTNDGTRLTRSGPLLVGPHGPCSTSGNALNCP